MDGQTTCWRDRVRVTTRPIEEIAVDLLVVPGPHEGLWELQVDRACDRARARARAKVTLYCAIPPLGGADPGACAYDWIGAALETVVTRGDVTVAVPALTHPDGDGEIPRAVMAALYAGLARQPGIETVWIACASEDSASRWRAALFGEDPFHPLPGLGAEVMRRYGSVSSSCLIPERAYQGRSSGSFSTDSAWVQYRFGSDEEDEYLELLEARGDPCALLRLLFDAGGGLVEFEGILSLLESAGPFLSTETGLLRWCPDEPSNRLLPFRDCPSLCELEAGRALPMIEGSGQEGC